MTEVDGMGVSRDEIISSLAQQGTAFVGEEKNVPEGQPSHWAGETDNGLVTLDLIGDKDDLTRVGLIFGVPAGDYIQSATGILCMGVILKDIFPEWDERNDWILSALEQVSSGEKDNVETTQNGKKIFFFALREAGIYCLDIEAISPSDTL